MSARNCQCRESRRFSCWMVVAGVLAFAALAHAGQEEGPEDHLVALSGDPNAVGAWGDTTSGGEDNAGQTNDPISTSIGEYYFTKPLMNLGGPLPL